MRIRQEQMRKHYFDGTCRAIEIENAIREEQERRAKPAAPASDVSPDCDDGRDPVEIARAANAALRGEAAA